jgi:hypothetical protein
MATVTFIKYERQSAGALRGVAGYVSQEEKTMQENGQQLISGLNCNPQLACQEFFATRAMYRKDSPVYFYHYVQSFHPDETVTGELAHEVAKEFAARAWPDSEVLIATHMDAPHMHSHFIVNAVCYETGQMLRQGPRTLATLRPLSDEICLSHHLSVLSKQQKKSQGLSAREYRAAAKGESWKFRLINVIDDCMKYAHTKDEFIALMKSEGYGVRWEDSRQSITYTTTSGYKCRDDRLHDERYLKEAMEHEFRIRQRLVDGGFENPEYATALTKGAEYAGDSTGINDEGSVRDSSATDGAVHAVAGGTSDRTGVAGPYEHAGRADMVRGAADQAVGEAPVPPNQLRHEGASGYDDQGADGDPHTARTGWEAERAALFAPPAQAASAAPVSGVAAHPGNSDGVVGSVVELGHALERDQLAPPIKDATTTPQHMDSKALKKERQQKIAAGHKSDDHEDEQTWQQTM